ncbi:hypothetical protein EO95_06230 [Methanosarcina sp. 1.H.T.1A.1]|nr:hypothetical protein EO95_06230 [Methanosarcina sp. 1.H.T.1A.1]
MKQNAESDKLFTLIFVLSFFMSVHPSFLFLPIESNFRHFFKNSEYSVIFTDIFQNLYDLLYIRKLVLPKLGQHFINHFFNFKFAISTGNDSVVIKRIFCNKNNEFKIYNPLSADVLSIFTIFPAIVFSENRPGYSNMCF